ncbi:hypothetical protein K2X33_02710 [bacterium]|nr:hypothetical protein [bacterium]
MSLFPRFFMGSFAVLAFSSSLTHAGVEVQTLVGIRKSMLRQELQGQLREVRAVLSAHVPVKSQFRKFFTPAVFVTAGLVGANCADSLWKQGLLAFAMAGAWGINHLLSENLVLVAQSEDGESVAFRLDSNPIQRGLLSHFLRGFMGGQSLMSWRELPSLDIRLNAQGRIIGFTASRVNPEDDDALPGYNLKETESELEAYFIRKPGLRFPSVLDLVREY